MFCNLTGFIVLGCVAAILAEKTSTSKPLLETASHHVILKTTEKPHTDAKVEQVLHPPNPPKETKPKDLKSADSFGIGYYGYPIAYGGYYPSYYPYYPYYRRHYGYGYPYRPYFGYRPYGAVFGVSVFG